MRLERSDREPVTRSWLYPEAGSADTRTGGLAPWAKDRPPSQEPADTESLCLGARSFPFQYGAAHAWTEIYLPGAGWHGFDPTNNKHAGTEHISVAVAWEQEKAMPLSGSWEGPVDASDRMEISVQVAPV